MGWARGRAGEGRFRRRCAGARRAGGAGACCGAMSGLLGTSLGGLSSDSYCDISQYRDQHFRVRRGTWGRAGEGVGVRRAVGEGMGVAGPPALTPAVPPGEPVPAGEVAEGVVDAVRGEPVLLHHGGADPGALLQVRRRQAHRHGSGQDQEDAVRLLLRGVSCSRCLRGAVPSSRGFFAAPRRVSALSACGTGPGRVGPLLVLARVVSGRRRDRAVGALLRAGVSPALCRPGGRLSWRCPCTARIAVRAITDRPAQ